MGRIKGNLGFITAVSRATGDKFGLGHRGSPRQVGLADRLTQSIATDLIGPGINDPVGRHGSRSNLAGMTTQKILNDLVRTDSPGRKRRGR